jgi:hypothetical protein
MKHVPFPRCPAPKMSRVWQRQLDRERLADPRREVYDKLMAAGLREKVRRGARIAITAGSRDEANFLDMLNGAVAAVKDAGGEPFLVPAMGSHGSATAEGQTEILRRLGVADSVAAPISASMDTILLGKAENGAEAHVDRIAHEADGIVVLGRTQTHPESATGLASGLLKMTTVGLGKQRGAQQAHNHGLWKSICVVPRLHLAKTKILFGVAMVENSIHQAKLIEVVKPKYEAFLESDERLLKVSQAALATIPFDHLDVLIVDEIGKTVSGTGMDLNVVGSWRATGKGANKPEFKRIVVLSLTKGSLGNGLGIGMADFTTKRFMEEYDTAATYMNLLTATEPGTTTREGPLPLALESDREAIEIAVYSALTNGNTARIVRIRNTALLEEMWVSENLLEEVSRNPNLSVVDRAAIPFNYNISNNLW